MSTVMERPTVKKADTGATISRERKEEIRATLKTLFRDHVSYTRWIVKFGNSLRIKKDGKDQKSATAYTVTAEYREHLNSIMGDTREKLKATDKKIVEAVREHPLWTEILKGYKGVSELSAGVLIACFDIEKAENASKMCAYAGLAPGRDRRVKGGTGFNQDLKTYLIGGLGFSLEKSQGTISRQRYLEYKNRLMNSENTVEEIQKGGAKKIVMWKDARPGHRRLAAVRYMIKCFLQYDLYPAWRELEGLSVRPPYAEEYLGRKHHVDPAYLESLEAKCGNVPGEEEEDEFGEE